MSRRSRLSKDDSVRFMRWMMLRIFRTALKCIYITIWELSEAGGDVRWNGWNIPILQKILTSSDRTTVGGDGNIFIYKSFTLLWCQLFELPLLSRDGLTFCKSNFMFMKFSTEKRNIGWSEILSKNTQNSSNISEIHHFCLFTKECLFVSVFRVVSFSLSFFPFRKIKSLNSPLISSPQRCLFSDNISCS